MGLLLSIAGNLFVTALYDIITITDSLKAWVLFDSGFGLLVLIVWFTKIIAPLKK